MMMNKRLIQMVPGAGKYIALDVLMQWFGLAADIVLFHDTIANNIRIANLDALNEVVILKSLKEKCGGKTIVIVSHRKPTLTIADTVYEMKSGKLS